MTHRSRTGGPIRRRGQKKQTHTRKLHHPPPKPLSDVEGSEGEDEATPPLPASVFLENPTEEEILQVIHHALRDTLDSSSFPASVQKVKSLLYDKKWLEVFCNPALLESYAGRWVPSRACCYRELFASLASIRKIFTIESDGQTAAGLGSDDEEEEEEEDADESEEGQEDNEAGAEEENNENDEDPDVPTTTLTTRILSLGGGASSELLAVASLIKACLDAEPNVTARKEGKSLVRWQWTGIDIGSWQSVVDKFTSSLETEWGLQDDVLDVKFIKGDLIKSADEEGASSNGIPPIDIAPLLQGSPPNLITILFTLTELLSQSRPATFSALRSITKHTTTGTLLLVADSASDIGEFQLGSSGRKWPVWMLLDMILLGPPSTPPGESGWICVRKEESRWHRLPEGVGAGWPVKLENTRYWLRLYRRV